MWELGYCHVVCKSNCWEDVRLVKGEVQLLHLYKDIILDIKSLIAQQLVCSMEHILLVENHVTNALAKKGAEVVASFEITNHVD